MSEPVAPLSRAAGPSFASDDLRAIHAPRTSAAWIALAAYLVLAVAAFRPLLPWSTDALPRGGLGDPAQMLWFLAYTPHAITHGLNPFTTNLIDYPSGVDLANNTSVPLLGLIGWPITALAGPIATFNVLIRLGLALSGFSMYLVLGRWCRTFGARFLGGLAYGFGPAVIDQTVANTHLNLLFVPLLPVIVVACDELFIRQRWSIRRSAATLGLSSAAQMLISPELLSDLAIVVGIVLAVLALSHPKAVGERVGYALRGITGALGIAAVLSGYLVYEMIAGPNRVKGAVYPVAHLQAYRNTIRETLLPTLQQALSSAHLQLLASVPTKDPNELGGYLSVPLVCFLLVSVIAYRRRRAVPALALGVIVAFILSLGEEIHLGAHAIWLPERVLTVLPLLKSTIPSRFSLDTLLAASMLFAIGIDETWAAMSAPSHRVRSAAGVLSLTSKRLILMITVAVIGIFLVPRAPFSERTMIWTTTLAQQIARVVRPGAVVLAYPYPLPPYDEAMAWQAVTGFSYRLLGGYATVPGAGDSGEEWPITQHPIQVQRELGELELGGHSPFPHTTQRISRQALCRFVATYHVHDIVITPYGAREPLALSYLDAVPHRSALADGPVRVLAVTQPTKPGALPC